MNIQEIIEIGRELGWPKRNLSEIIVRMGKIFGDICRWERNAKKDVAMHTDDELKKEMGNVIVCAVRWCDDLGYDPEECIERAIECQEEFEK